MNDWFGVRETAMTKAQWTAATEGKTRDISDPYMQTWRADKTRAMTATSYESPIPESPKRTPLELIPELRMEHGRSRAACGTAAGYTAHLRELEDACPECRAAHSRKRADDRDRSGRPSRRKAS